MTGDEVSQRPTIGEKDEVGETVQTVLIEHDDYSVYITEQVGVRWWARNAEVAERIHGIDRLLAQATSLQTGRLRKHESVNRQVARAIGLAFGGEVENANHTLERVVEQITRMRLAMGRLDYWLSGVLFMLVVGLLALWATLTDWWGASATLVVQVAFFGSLGALLSVSLRLTSLIVDPDDPHTMIACLGASRIAIGIVGAIFIYLLVRADVVLGFVGADNLYMTLCVAFLSGFSETLVPNILKRMEERVTDSEEGPGSNARAAS